MYITLELSQELQELYLQFAKEQHITKEELMQKALVAYMQDLQDLAIALEGHKDRLNGDEGIDADKLYRQLGI